MRRGSMQIVGSNGQGKTRLPKWAYRINKWQKDVVQRGPLRAASCRINITPLQGKPRSVSWVKKTHKPAVVLAKQGSQEKGPYPTKPTLRSTLRLQTCGRERERLDTTSQLSTSSIHVASPTPCPFSSLTTLLPYLLVHLLFSLQSTSQTCVRLSASTVRLSFLHSITRLQSSPFRALFRSWSSPQSHPCATASSAAIPFPYTLSSWSIELQTNSRASIVGQAGCQIANSCWEVSFPQTRCALSGCPAIPSTYQQSTPPCCHT